METNTNNRFIEASKRERFCLSNILPIIKNSKYEWSEYMTDIYSYDVYDCLLQASIDGSVKKRFIIEIKIRDTHFDELILETKKLRDLKSKVLDHSNTEILYINVTPNKTYVFNLSKMEKEDKFSVNKLKANKATMESRTNKVDKNVIYLSITDARSIDFTFNEKEYQNSIKVVINENNRHKNNKNLFEYLFTNDGN